MLCRVAEDVFWMSRYVERAIAVVRLIDVTGHLELDAGDPDADDRELWAPVLASFGDTTSVPLARNGHAEMTSSDVRYELAFNPRNPNSLVSCVRRAREAARGVRETISSEMWEQLNTLFLSQADPKLAQEAEENPHAFYKRVREGAVFFQGLADSTLERGEAWSFITLGKYLERADNVTRVLSLQADLLAEVEPAGEDQTVRWLAVLRSCGSAEGYARYYSLRVEPARVIEFLLMNPAFPQSVRFSLSSAWRALQEIAEQRAFSTESANPAVRQLGLLQARLEHSAVDEVLDEGLGDFLADVQRRIALVSEHVTRTYLRDEPQPGRLVGVARAAMIMAAQQQQQ